MSKGIIPQIIEHNGHVLHRYTCRYMSQRQAEDKLESLFAEGVIDHTDMPIIHSTHNLHPIKSRLEEAEMSVADRNRKLKKILSDHFGRGKVTVRGHRGTAYGWVSVNIDVVPDSIEHRREMEAKVWEMIKTNDISIGTYGYDDPGSDYGYGSKIHINFADPDFNVQNEGSLFMLRANTEAGRQWTEEHIPSDAQRFGRWNVAVEHRYIADIVEGIKADGLSVR